MATNIITITDSSSTADSQGLLYQSGSPKGTALKLAAYFKRLAGGLGFSATAVDIQAGEGALVAASGTITIDHAELAADETVTIGGITFTAKSSGATGNQFNIGADATADATALKNAINASASTAGLYSATSALGVVTITAAQKGKVGNAITMATSDSDAYTLSAAALAGGVNATANSYSF